MTLDTALGRILAVVASAHRAETRAGIYVMDGAASAVGLMAKSGAKAFEKQRKALIDRAGSG